MISEMPATAFFSTLSAAPNASSIDTSSPSTSSSFSLRITITESTFCASSSMPPSAACMRFMPSKLNGLVTTATVSIPICFATSATRGAAPVPVPPPMPAVMNTMCAPRSASSICSRASIAAARPASGLAPAPKPDAPSWIWFFACPCASAWASVFMAMNSTPCTVLRIM